MCITSQTGIALFVKVSPANEILCNSYNYVDKHFGELEYIYAYEYLNSLKCVFIPHHNQTRERKVSKQETFRERRHLDISEFDRDI